MIDVDFIKSEGRHVTINLDLYDLDVSPSEMEQCIGRALSSSTMYDRDIKNVDVVVRKIF